MSIVRLFALATLLLAVMAPLASTAAQDDNRIPANSEQVELVGVIDGDTFDVDYDLGKGVDQDRIRMIGIDTPETNYSYGNEPECYGAEASQRTKALLESASEIFLVRDEDPVDNNDRLLRYVWYISGTDGQSYFLNEQLVEEGYAEAKTYQPNVTYQNELDAAEERAKATGAGMWGGCDGSAQSVVQQDPQAPVPTATSVTSESVQTLTLPDDVEEVELIDVIDGDTFDVDYDLGRGVDQDRIRMIGIDTPETNYSYGNEPECYGKEATGRTESLLVAATAIYLERDEDPVDSNDRLLRYVWYVSGIDGQLHFLNVDLVEEGYALAKTYEPNTKHQDELDAAENRAISEGRGMWTSCDASVSLDPALEQDGEPDSEPIDRSQEPATVSDEDAACSFFSTQSEAQDFLDEFPEISPDLDPDQNGIACDGYYR